MPIVKEPCRLCESHAENHAAYSPHCQYCGQAYEAGQGAGGFWYKGVEYYGHLDCIFVLGGPEVELWFMKMATGAVTLEQRAAQRPKSVAEEDN